MEQAFPRRCLWWWKVQLICDAFTTFHRFDASRSSHFLCRHFGRAETASKTSLSAGAARLHMQDSSSPAPAKLTGFHPGRIEMVERPQRYRNAIVPHIYVDGASDAIDFYKRALGAVELFRIAGPKGRILHAEISICGSVVMIGDPDDRLYGEPRALGRCTAGLHVFLNDNQALLQRAVEAGAEAIQAPTDMFYGASSASLRDPFGHVWVLLSWKEDLDPAEMERRGNALSSS
jgi:PhnB protein